MKVQHVEYHGAQWCALVEQGWVTSTVETLHDGTRIARMIYCPTRYRYAF